MLKQERLDRICEIVSAEGIATVVDLAQMLGVSQMTIRRDLNELDSQRILRRIHGGATTPNSRRDHSEPPVLERMEENAAIKRALGLAIAATISDRETIFLGSGTTTLAVADALAEMPKSLTVITNALTIANTLAPIHEITVIVLGGFLRRSELSLVGHITEASLRDLHVDRVIMGMRGIDPDQGLTSDHLQELMTDQAIMDMSSNVVIVADYTKFGYVAPSRTADVTAASTIITDTNAPQTMVEAIRAKGVEVITVEAPEEGQEIDDV